MVGFLELSGQYLGLRGVDRFVTLGMLEGVRREWESQNNVYFSKTGRIGVVAF